MNVLVFGPLGTNPWFPAREVAERLRAFGWTVDAHDPSSGVEIVPYPEPYNPRSLAASWLPYYFVHRLMAFMRWRKHARALFGSYDVIFVWDPLICVMLRLARPRGTRIVWTETLPVVEDAWNGVLLRLARTLADRTIDADAEWYEAVGSHA